MSDPRPGNLGRADYPRMLYQADGRMIIVHSPEEHDKLHAEGWDTVPGEMHQQRPVTPSPAMGTHDPMGEMFRQILNEVLDERNIGKRRR